MTCGCNSQSYTFLFIDPLLRLFSYNLHWDISKFTEADGEKGNILKEKLETGLLRNFFVTCEFISPSYNFVFKKQFANTVVVESEK